MSRNLIFAVLLYTFIIQNIITVNTDCEVCGANQFCRTACERPFDPRITSSLSLTHCGLASFRTKKKRSKVQSRIVNGKDAIDREFPWIVSLFVNVSYLGEIMHNHHCGGVLITPRYVLTAAHCGKLENWFVMYGSNSKAKSKQSAYVVEVDEVVYHPNYDRKHFNAYLDDKSMTSDIMVLKLKREINIKVSDNRFDVNTVCLPNKDTPIFNPHPMASGWGIYKVNLQEQSLESPDWLQKTELLIPSYDKCATMMRETKLLFLQDEVKKREAAFDLNHLADRYNTSKVICAFVSVPPGLGLIQHWSAPYKGDSGSPLLLQHNGREYTVGVTSSGIIDQGAPIVFYTSVSYYIDWIEKVVSGQYSGEVLKVKH